jgi:hypothetical protein
MIRFNLPNCFVPEEIEFQMYCAIQLYKGSYITVDEAIGICGYSNMNKEKFYQICNTFEKRYKKICGRAYTDWEYEEDSEERI